MKKHEAIAYVISTFAGVNEWGDVELMQLLRMINNGGGEESLSRVELHQRLESDNICLRGEIISYQVLSMMDWADANGIRTVKLDGTEKI
jgi:hypothetical protein